MLQDTEADPLLKFTCIPIKEGQSVFRVTKVHCRERQTEKESERKERKNRQQKGKEMKGRAKPHQKGKKDIQSLKTVL